MGHPLHILTSHNVVAYVNSQTFTMTSLRQRRMSKVLEAPNLFFTHEGINMADNMGTGEPHFCEQEVLKEEKVRIDLKAEQIPGSEKLFTDGCCFRKTDGDLSAGYAVVRQTETGFETVKAEQLQGQQSAQRAEVRAVIAALEWGKGKKVTIYTDSAYAFGAAHVELGQWQRAGFLPAGNKPIKHEKEMRELAEAIVLPLEVAIVKCKGHDSSDSEAARGNRVADQAAKEIAGYSTQLMMVTVEEELRRKSQWTEETIRQEQKGASPQEQIVWKQRGATETQGLWRGPDGRLLLPPGLRQIAFEEAHGLGHVGTAQMERNLNSQWWHPFMKNMVKDYVRQCSTCTAYNSKPTIKPELGTFPILVRPGQEIVIDYTDMIVPVKGFRYVLMCVDNFTGWPG
ncbi:uncharacterized protein LOC106512767, partial [Austrofundulus limnaeus]|uniref:Uncharacterized protein LOC106512767 n=1 Tax=Austrofundulus limnaeus TaxID=52670 RepID=A0A2I4AMT8_AUSLI